MSSFCLLLIRPARAQNTATACGQTVTYPKDGCAPCTQALDTYTGALNFSTPNQTICVTGTSTITGINSTTSDTVRICGNATITGPLSSWGTPINIIIASGATLTWEIDPSAGASRNITNYGTNSYNAGISNVNNVTYISASTNAHLNIVGNYTLNGINTFVFLGGTLDVTGTFTLNSSVNALCLSNNASISTNSFITTADNNILVDPASTSCISYSSTAAANGHYLSQNEMGVCQRPGASNPTYTGVPNFGPEVTVTPDCNSCEDLLSLPLTLQSFTATATTINGVQLQWITAQEINTDRFQVHRSTDGLGFETIGTVSAAGNSSTPVAYHYTDRLPATGINYYRLKMIDKDEQYTYSPIEAIRFNGANTILKLISNTRSNLLFNLSQVGSKASVKLVDLQGRVLWQKNIPAGQAQLNVPVAGIISGIYLIQYSDSDKQASQRVFVQH